MTSQFIACAMAHINLGDAPGVTLMHTESGQLAAAIDGTTVRMTVDRSIRSFWKQTQAGNTITVLLKAGAETIAMRGDGKGLHFEHRGNKVEYQRGGGAWRAMKAFWLLEPCENQLLLTSPTGWLLATRDASGTARCRIDDRFIPRDEGSLSNTTKALPAVTRWNNGTLYISDPDRHHMLRYLGHHTLAADRWFRCNENIHIDI